MKKMMWFVLIVLMLVPLMMPEVVHADPPRECYVEVGTDVYTSGPLYVRTGPFEDSRILATVAHGTKMRARRVDFVGNWVIPFGFDESSFFMVEYNPTQSLWGLVVRRLVTQDGSCTTVNVTGPRFDNEGAVVGSYVLCHMDFAVDHAVTFYVRSMGEAYFDSTARGDTSWFVPQGVYKIDLYNHETGDERSLEVGPDCEFEEIPETDGVVAGITRYQVLGSMEYADAIEACQEIGMEIPTPAQRRGIPVTLRGSTYWWTNERAELTRRRVVFSVQNGGLTYHPEWSEAGTVCVLPMISVGG